MTVRAVVPYAVWPMSPQERNPKALTVSAVVVAAGAALFLGRELFQPVAIAVLLAVILRPVVRGLERLRVPTPVGAGVVVLALIGAGVAGGYALADPVESWFKNA